MSTTTEDVAAGRFVGTGPTPPVILKRRTIDTVLIAFGVVLP